MAHEEEIHFVDLYAVFKRQKDFLTADGVHLNGKGYDLWSGVVRPLIKE